MTTKVPRVTLQKSKRSHFQLGEYVPLTNPCKIGLTCLEIYWENRSLNERPVGIPLKIFKTKCEKMFILYPEDSQNVLHYYCTSIQILSL